MTLKLRVITLLSALCFLGSTACFSAAAADALYSPSGDDEQPAVEQPVAEEPVYVEPAPEPTPEPAPEPTPEPANDPEPVISVDPEPEVPDDPGYIESVPEEQPVVSVPDDEPAQPAEEPIYSGTYSEIISEGNFPQPIESQAAQDPDYTYANTTSSYVNTEQYNQYIYNNNMAQYDDDYIYIPQYEAPAESLVNTSSKTIDTDELTKDDWHSIMLDLSRGDHGDGGNKTFNFIKENSEEGDTNMMWMVYAGVALILASIVMIIFVIVSSGKEKYTYEYE